MMSLVFTACQSNSYKVSGHSDKLQDGDVVYVTSDFTNGTPTDSTMVKNGSFEFTGKIDSTRFCMVYAKKEITLNTPFFIEPGNISITLSNEPEKNKVYGTDTNNKWQQLMDSTMSVGKQINMIATYIYQHQLQGEEQAAEMAKIQKLQKQNDKYVIRLANDNIANEFGYFLVTYYLSAEEATPQGLLTLLNKLPEEKRKRPLVAEKIKQTEELVKLEVGNTIEPLALAGIDGKQVDILKEAANHKMTILDFWASWCRPCRQEMPNLVSIYASNKDKGLGIIGISLDNKAEAWKQAVRDLGMKWTQVSDLKGWKSDAAARFGVRAIPMIYIIDSKGTILAKGLRGEELKAFVEKGL